MKRLKIAIITYENLKSVDGVGEAVGTIAIIGGGAGGASAARSLKKQLGAEHQIILVEKESQVYNQASIPLLSVGRRKRADLTRSIASLSRWGIQVIIDKAALIEPNIRRIQTEHREIRYDLAIIAAGAEMRTDRLPGMAAAGINIHSPDGAANLASRIQSFQGEEIAILSVPKHIKYPSTPYEYALLLEDWFKRRGLSKDISISIFSHEVAPMSIYGERTSDAVAELLLKRNIHLHMNCRIKQVDPERKCVQLGEGSFPFDLMLYCPEPAPPSLIKESGLADAEGWLPVDRYSLVSQQEGIMGIGDVTRIFTPAGETLPKIGAVAYPQSLIAARNAVRLLKGEKIRDNYNGGASFLVETGRGALPLAGNFYRDKVNFRPFPITRLYIPFKAMLTERLWAKNH